MRSTTGAHLEYLLKKPAQKLTLEILDGDGKSSGPSRARFPRPNAAAPARRQSTARRAKRSRTPTRPLPHGGARRPRRSQAGLDTFTWDLEYQPVIIFPGMVLWGATTNGPMALPGKYQVRLTVDGQTMTQPLTVKHHPFYTASDADLQAQFELASRIRDKVNEANNAVIQIRRIKKEVADRMSKSNDADLKAIANRLVRNLTAVEEAVYQVQNQSNEDPLNFPDQDQQPARLAAARGRGRATASR